MWNPFRVFFVKQDVPSDARNADSYFEKLIKYIPADIVAAWLAIDGILRDQTSSPLWLVWSVFGFLTVLTPLYVVYMKTDPPGFGPTKTFHWMASTLAFVVPWYRPLYGTVVLILTTLMLPLFERFFTRQLPTIPPKK